MPKKTFSVSQWMSAHSDEQPIGADTQQTDDCHQSHDNVELQVEGKSVEETAYRNNHFSDGQSDNGNLDKWINGESPGKISDGNNQNTISPNNQSGAENTEMVKADELPSIPDEVYSHLPSFLKDCVNHAKSIEDRDIVLLGTIACISACFPNVRGVYDKDVAYANFYLFVTADAGMGKGALTMCREIVKGIDRELREISKRQAKEYKERLASSSKSKGENVDIPEEPRSRMLIIPANSSSSAFLKILSDNYGQGLLFETEGDTLSQTLRSDYGNYSDVLRKAFHHEPVSQSRRKDNEFFDINETCLSVVLAGTPQQVRNLIHDAENGLLSRFCFYCIPFRRSIRNVFATSDLSLSRNAIFRQLGERFMRERTAFMQRGEFTFLVPELLQAPFTDWLRSMNDECCTEIDSGMQGVVRRMGLVAFRIMMILTIVREFGYYTAKEQRLHDGTIPLVCHDEDYHTAICISNTLIEHAKSIYCKLADREKSKEIQQNGQKVAMRRSLFFEKLPDKFSRADYDKKVTENDENLSTAGKWIKIFIREGRLQRLAQGEYAKVPQKENVQNQLCNNSKNQQL